MDTRWNNVYANVQKIDLQAVFKLEVVEGDLKYIAELLIEPEDFIDVQLSLDIEKYVWDELTTKVQHKIEKVRYGRVQAASPSKQSYSRAGFRQSLGRGCRYR